MESSIYCFLGGLRARITPVSLEAIMRISQYAQQSVQALGISKSSGSDTSSRTSQATSAVQLRLSETGKTLSKAAVAKEDIARVDAGLVKLQKAIAKAQTKDLTAEDLSKAQADFVRARTDVASAAETQAANLKDAPPEVRRAGAISPKELGTKASASIASVKDLDKIDLSTASPEQLAEAAKVVQSARDQVSQRQAVATRPVEALTRKVTVLENTVATLGGETSKAQKRQLDALQFLQNAAATQTPLSTGVNLFA